MSYSRGLKVRFQKRLAIKTECQTVSMLRGKNVGPPSVGFLRTVDRLLSGITGRHP